MNKIMAIILLVGFLINSENVKIDETNSSVPLETKSDKVKVLNFVTFHMGNTSDANSVEFDETNKKNQSDAKQIASLIAEFDPSIICVEVQPKKNEELNEEYQKYLKNPEEGATYRRHGKK